MKTNKLLTPIPMLAAGLILGAAARLFDIYFPNLGEIFSQMSVWILAGTLIAIYSPTKKAAMQNIFPFCMGMLFTYYLTAMLTHGVYGWYGVCMSFSGHGIFGVDDQAARSSPKDHRRRDSAFFHSIQYFAY